MVAAKQQVTVRPFNRFLLPHPFNATHLKYPLLSDEDGEARKAYSVGKGLLGLSEGRVTYFINKDGTVRYVSSS